MPLWLATAKAPKLNAFLSGEENVKLAEMAVSTRQADAHFQATDLPKEFRYKSGIRHPSARRADQRANSAWRERVRCVMGSFGGELTRDTSDVQTSSTITMRARTRDKPNTTPMNTLRKDEGRQALSLPPPGSLLSRQQLGVVDNVFIERTCGPLEAVRIRI